MTVCLSNMTTPPSSTHMTLHTKVEAQCLLAEAHKTGLNMVFPAKSDLALDHIEGFQSVLYNLTLVEPKGIPYLTLVEN